MLRLVTASFIAALLVAPLGFGPSSSTFVANLARLLFAGLMLVFILFVALAVHWSRRWVVGAPFARRFGRRAIGAI